MTIPAPTAIPQAIKLIPTPAIEGCTHHRPNGARCDSQRTVTLDSKHGRRCADHATLPEHRYRPDLAADMVEMGRPDSAFTYLLWWLTREADRRFHLATVRLVVR